jgi:hypothetical protein
MMNAAADAATRLKVPDLAAQLEAAANAARPFQVPDLSRQVAAAANSLRWPDLTKAVEEQIAAAWTSELSASLEAATAAVNRMPNDWLSGKQILGAIEGSAVSSAASSAAFKNYLDTIQSIGRTAPELLVPPISARELDAPIPISTARAAGSERPPAPPEPPAAPGAEPEPDKPFSSELVAVAINQGVNELGAQVRAMGLIAQAAAEELRGLRTDLRDSTKSAAQWSKAIAGLTIAVVLLTAVLAAPTMRDWLGVAGDWGRALIDRIGRR